jgi:hypothetical protein
MLRVRRELREPGPLDRLRLVAATSLEAYGAADMELPSVGPIAAPDTGRGGLEPPPVSPPPPQAAPFLVTASNPFFYRIVATVPKIRFP